MALTPGTVLGAFEITGQLGVGGMGEVYRATDTTLEREVAIKTLPAALATDAERLARFEREAKLLASLNHAHIASVYGLGEHEGARFIAMELVEGQSLEEKLKSGALPAEQALELGLQIASALEAAHGKGVVHRDLKPANIMITFDGVVKVLDFGLAKAFSGDRNAASPAHSPTLSLAMTQQGLILGTAGYMSPEQASGQATDQRTDIWAFGVVLYEMLTGLPLFSGESAPHILADVLRTEPDWKRLPKNLHPRLKVLLERCLEKKVRNRYHSIADVRIEVERLVSDPQGAVVAVDHTVRPAASKTARVAVSVALVAAGAVAAGIIGWSLWPEPAPAMIDRWSHSFPPGLLFRNRGRPVIALSPDGRRFVYNTTDGLYVRSMDELEARRIPGTEEALTNPFFSPDGQSVAYWTNDGKLKRVALSGGAPIPIAEGLLNLNGASWSSDGTILLGQPDGIYRVPANGGTPQRVIEAKDGERLYGPELLPDGDSVLFSATLTQSWDDARIAVQSLSSGERIEVMRGGSDAQYVPTGHLVYALGDGLAAIAFDAATLAVSGGPVSLFQGVSRARFTAAANYGIANDGTLVYVSGFGGSFADPTAVWVDRDGEEQPLGFEPCNCFSFDVSPDGTRVALQQLDATEQAHIWVWTLSDRIRTKLTFEPGLQIGPTWSPDSTRIAYSAAEGGLFVRPADGTGMPERLLESSSTLVAWDWTADDELIFTEATNSPTGRDIAVLSMRGDHERRPLLTSKFNEYRPALSPNGRWLAYESNESPTIDIFVVPFPNVDDGKWQVSSGGGAEPYWSLDGHTLFYLGPESLMEMAVGDGDGGQFSHGLATAVLDRSRYVYNATPPRSYAVSSDGQHFLLSKPGEGASTVAPQVIVITNWVEELKRRVPTK
jgi:eukaryotic-like serine/threonine-protein kinase